MSMHGTIGPFWFEDDSGNALSVNTQRYVEPLRSYVGLWVHNEGGEEKHSGFNKVEPHSHTAGESLDWLSTHFGRQG